MSTHELRKAAKEFNQVRKADLRVADKAWYKEVTQYKNSLRKFADDLEVLLDGMEGLDAGEEFHKPAQWKKLTDDFDSWILEVSEGVRHVPLKAALKAMDKLRH